MMVGLLALVCSACAPDRPTDPDELVQLDYDVTYNSSWAWHRNRAVVRAQRGMFDGAIEDNLAAIDLLVRTENHYKQAGETPGLVQRCVELLDRVEDPAHGVDLNQRVDADLAAHAPEADRRPVALQRGRALLRARRLPEVEALAADFLAEPMDTPEYRAGFELMQEFYRQR
jgi:hypothetical protein